jgi:short-subunit dehydrogenase
MRKNDSKRVILTTGASSGIGKDAALRLIREGHIDVLVNNAGYAIYGAVEDTSIEDARRQFEVNMVGVAALAKAVLAHLRNQRYGRIINTSSMAGKIYTPLGAWYHATQHALEGWSDCLRIETASFGIDGVIVEPGEGFQQK